MPPTMRLRLSDFGSSGCCREKASNRLVSVAARWAGTPAIVSQIGFGVALDYLMALGMDEIAKIEAALARHALMRFSALPDLKLFRAADAGPIFAFAASNAPAPTPQRLALRLAERGFAVRAGTFCAQPLLDHLGAPALCRASLSFTNTETEIDVVADALTEILASE